MTVDSIALIYQETEQWEQAENYFHQALTGYQELGDVHGETVTLVNLGRLYFRMERFDEAIQLANHAQIAAKAHQYTHELKRIQKLQHALERC